MTNLILLKIGNKYILLTTFTESGLCFTFSKRWKVLKYDEHRFYRYLSGSGFKGVDFIGMSAWSGGSRLSSQNDETLSEVANMLGHLKQVEDILKQAKFK